MIRLISKYLLIIAVFLFLPFLVNASTRYPKAVTDSKGTWIATDEALVQINGDLWIFHTSKDGLPSDRVRALALDTREIWAATPHGLGRMDRNSGRWEVFLSPDFLPSDNVLSIEIDEHFVWSGTDKGAVKYSKSEREWTIVTNTNGPGTNPVYDIKTMGQNVWFATENGVYIYSRLTQKWQYLGIEVGFTFGAVFEIIHFGKNLWFICKNGLIRYDLRTEAVSTYNKENGLLSSNITGFSSIKGDIWIGSDKGIQVYNPGSDSISSFIYSKGMPKGAVTGIEVSLPWVFVSTDLGLGIFNTLQNVWSSKNKQDGLESTVIQGLILAGTSLIILEPDYFQSYNIPKDEWLSYSILDIYSGQKASLKKSSNVNYNMEFTMSSEGSYTESSGKWNKSAQLIPEIRLGAGASLNGDRSLDASMHLDGGDLMPDIEKVVKDSSIYSGDVFINGSEAKFTGIREYDFELRYHSNEKNDNIKEVIVSDELPMHNKETENNLLDSTWLEGAGGYMHFGNNKNRKKDPITVDVEAGVKRGIRYREFFRGSLDMTYRLEKQYIIHGSDFVKVDGMIFERGVDYIITHTTGQLTFLNPDRINALSLIEITYSYEQIPHKATGGSSILEMLPRDNELGEFTRDGSPTYITDESGLYYKIDGAAPKYIDRGWMESVFMKYSESSTSVEVNIHDMDNTENAKDIFNYDQPVSYIALFEEPDAVALLDQSLPSGYAVKMVMDKYYVELSIDEKSRSSEILITLFAQAIKSKGDLSGTLIDSLRPMIGRIHTSYNPFDNFGIGGGFIATKDLDNNNITDKFGTLPKQSELALLDFTSNNQFGSNKLDSFFQIGGSRLKYEGNNHITGKAASGNVIFNSQSFNMRVDGEMHSKNFNTLGNRQTPFGTFAGNLRADSTLKPVRWLSLRLLYDHERSYLSLENSNLSGNDYGTTENIMSKLSIIKSNWPTIWILAGRSILKGADLKDEKLRFAGSMEYDLAKGLLNGFRFRKLALKAYADYSNNEVKLPEDSQIDLPGLLKSTPSTAENQRVELMAAPTNTEDGYLRFERKIYNPKEGDSNEEVNPLETWEMVMGAASRYIEGIVPTFNGKMTYYKGSKNEESVSESAQALLSGQLDLFLGRWINSLSSTMLSLGYGYTNAEEAEDKIMDIHLQKHQIEGRFASGKYDDLFRLESRGKWWIIKEDETLADTERYSELINRLTYRPIYTSPVTLRFNYGKLEQLYENKWGTTNSILPSLEWERRWSRKFLSRIRMETSLRSFKNVYNENLDLKITYEEWTIKPLTEFRLHIHDFWNKSMLRLNLRLTSQWIDWFDKGGLGAEKSWELTSSLYLNWEKAGSFITRIGINYTRHNCIEFIDETAGAKKCNNGLDNGHITYNKFEPSMKIIAKF